jgi:hypothetical protein
MEKVDPRVVDFNGIRIVATGPDGTDYPIGVVQSFEVTEEREIRAISRIDDPDIIQELVPAGPHKITLTGVVCR